MNRILSARPRAMAGIAWLLLLAAALLACSPVTTTPAETTTATAGDTSAAVTPWNGTPFTDTDGDVINAHGGGFLAHDGSFYWVGENRGSDDRFGAISLYRSDDLVSWTYVSDILTQESDPELASATVERPKLLFNDATDTFVLWMHWENGADYSQARVAVATSPTIDDDYAYQGSFRPLGYESRDFTVFQDDDGEAYLASSTSGNADMNLYRLDDAYTGVDELVASLWPGSYREAPAMFRRGDVYFLLTSGATGWTANQAQYATAASPEGPWSPLRDVGDDEAFGSQAAYVLPIVGDTDTSFLYAGDRWGGARGEMVNDSDYVWLEVTFPTPSTLWMEWSDRLAIDTDAGTIDARTEIPWPFAQLVDATTGLCLDAPSGGAGAQLTTWECTGAANQEWQLVRTGDASSWQLRSKDSGLCVTVSVEGEAMLAECEVSPSQSFTPTAAADADALLLSADGTCLTTTGAAAGSTFALADCTAEDATRFFFSP